jgi:hypothetical protein
MMELFSSPSLTLLEQSLEDLIKNSFLNVQMVFTSWREGKSFLGQETQAEVGGVNTQNL